MLHIAHWKVEVRSKLEVDVEVELELGKWKNIQVYKTWFLGSYSS